MPFQQHPDWCSTEQMGTIAWPGWNIKLAIINIPKDQTKYKIKKKNYNSTALLRKIS